MTKLFLAAPLIFSTEALAACDPPVSPPQLQDKQIVCTLKGEAFIFVEGYQLTVHSQRSEESDLLCKALKPAVVQAPFVVG